MLVSCFQAGKDLKSFLKMNRKANAVKPWTQVNALRFSKTACQIMCRNPQRSGNFYERIHRWRFFPPLNATDKDGGKTGFFSQLFLTKLGPLSFGANGFTQEAAVRVDRHGRLRDSKREKSAMSLTTDYTCASTTTGTKCGHRFQTGTNDKITGQTGLFNI
jgi:hypothetical protein